MKVVNASKINGRYHSATQGRESVAGLSLPELFDIIANEYPKRSKMSFEGGLEWKAEQEAFSATKIMVVAQQSVV